MEEAGGAADVLVQELHRPVVATADFVGLGGQRPCQCSHGVPVVRGGISLAARSKAVGEAGVRQLLLQVVHDCGSDAVGQVEGAGSRPERLGVAGHPGHLGLWDGGEGPPGGRPVGLAALVGGLSVCLLDLPGVVDLGEVVDVPGSHPLGSEGVVCLVVPAPHAGGRVAVPAVACAEEALHRLHTSETGAPQSEVSAQLGLRREHLVFGFGFRCWCLHDGQEQSQPISLGPAKATSGAVFRKRLRFYTDLIYGTGG